MTKYNKGGHGQTWSDMEGTMHGEHEVTVASTEKSISDFPLCCWCCNAWRNGIEKAEALDMKEQVVTDARRVLKEEKARDSEVLLLYITDDKSDFL